MQKKIIAKKKVPYRQARISSQLLSKDACRIFHVQVVFIFSFKNSCYRL